MANCSSVLRASVVDLSTYRASRAAASSVIGMSIAHDGAVTAHPAQSVAPAHRLAVLSWCLGMASSLLDAYVDEVSMGGLQ
ncbi:hypothetical protein [Burkholderia gladioli]|uniref:hypothetical protein n=1 Tax=Burkholderia gladioli TaxID=28095 RepID=UPI001641E9FB|nr:hypothetical protein [Burkholderia gladioli]